MIYKYINMIMFTFFLLFALSRAQNLCTPDKRTTPSCAIRYSGLFLNCYCVYNSNLGRYERVEAMESTSEDIMLCQNTLNTTFCCANRFSEPGTWTVHDNKVYDVGCNYIADYTYVANVYQPTQVTGFVDVTVIPIIPPPDNSIPTTIVDLVNTPTPVPTVIIGSINVVPITSTQVVTATQVVIATQVVPVTNTQVVRATTTQVVKATSTQVVKATSTQVVRTTQVVKTTSTQVVKVTQVVRKTQVVRVTRTV
jgi:hypothetical protein